MGFTLDCETGKSTITSLSNGFSCSEEKLIITLQSIDIEDIYEKQWMQIDVPSEQYLYNYILENIGPHDELSNVYWFHLTRTTKDNMFHDGILPLGESLSIIWDTILGVTENNIIHANLLTMKNNGVQDDLYNLKVPDSFHWGPYAILVQDVAYYANQLGQHDYLAMPEIIEDICNGYEKQFGTSIYQLYEEHLIPKSIKFKSSKYLDVGCIEAAIYHAYTTVKNKPVSGGSISCFDAKGKNIPATDIVSVIEICPKK